jgi:hypothetical protein
VHDARTARRRVRRFARQAVQAAAVLLPEGLLPEVLRREAVPIVMVRPGLALRQEQAEAARRAVPADSRRGAEAQHPARPSAAVARRARAQQLAVPRPAESRPVVVRPVGLRLAEPAGQAAVAGEAGEARQAQSASAAQPQAARAELAVSDAGAPQPAAVSGAAVRPPEEGAGVLDVAAAPPQAAVRAAVAARLRVAQAAARAAVVAVRPRVAQGEVLVAAGVPRQAGRAALAVQPSAAAWAAPPSTRFRGDRLAPSARARSAHARGRLRTAQP